MAKLKSNDPWKGAAYEPAELLDWLDVTERLDDSAREIRLCLEAGNRDFYGVYLELEKEELG